MIKTICTLGLFSLLAVSCAGMSAGLAFGPAATATPIPTATTAPTRTTVPTATATPTPDYGIDMEKFTHIPESYDYLLAHLDEFVQAPDPLTERAAFDRWWNEEFLAALGDPIDRDIDMRVGGLATQQGGGKRGVVVNGKPDYGTLISQPGFFYFETNGEVFPVPVIDVAQRDESHVNFTMAIILFDYDIPYDMSIGTSLGLLQEGNYLYSIEIRGGDFPGDYSEAVREFNRNNRVVIDWDNRVAFGFGYIKPN